MKAKGSLIKQEVEVEVGNGDKSVILTKTVS